MKIGLVIDFFRGSPGADGKIVPRNGGTGIYLLELLRALLQIEPENEYFLIRHFPLQGPIIDDPRVKLLSLPCTVLGRGARLSGLWRDCLVKTYRLDLVHELVPCEPALRYARYPLVITVHDIIPLLKPQCFTFRNRMAFKLFTPHNLARAQIIICVSENTRKDLLRLFPGLENKVKVIPISGQTLNYSFPSQDLLNAYGIRKPYILSVSTIEPRKGHEAMFEAFSLLKAEGYPHQLVCIGGWGWKTSRIKRHPILQKLNSDVVMLSHVDTNILGLIYKGADLFLYPSLYEGFGLPPLEALQAGIPVLASSNSSMPEILGNAAHYLSPQPNGQEVFTAVKEVLAAPLSSRRENDVKGRERAGLYSWHRTARATLAAYYQAGGVNS